MHLEAEFATSHKLPEFTAFTVWSEANLESSTRVFQVKSCRSIIALRGM